jgi:uncharacterized tellurite resistance protein B-like protein
MSDPDPAAVLACLMGRRERNTALLKLLVALAWADGKIQAAELNFIKRLVLRFGLDDQIWAELDPYLEDPVNDAERQALARDLSEHLKLPGARAEVLGMLEHLTGSDETVTAEEKEALQEIRAVLQSDGSSGLLSGLKRLFGGAKAGARSSEHLSRDVDTFLQNKVLYRLRRQLKQREAQVEADDRRLSFWALFGGLMGRVIAADENLHEQEVQAIGRILAARSDLDAEHSALVTSVVSEESLKGLDRYRLIQGFLELSTPDERLMLVSCLFDVATADGDLPASEHEEIRGVAYGLGLSHRQFIDAKLPYTSRIKN